MEKSESELTGLALMRQPFDESQISKLPKPTRAQTEAVKNDYKKGIRCKLCGGWHHPDVVHLDYVGHAALTHRLLDCDPNWNWEPVAFGADSEPKLDQNGGMWIRLTVCGVTRLGYGHPDGKKGGDAIKEVIGDALRNAAMRFGAALDLWHKGDLHAGEDDGNDASRPTEPKVAKPAAPHAINFMPADGKPADNARITEMGRELYKHIKAAQSVDDIVKWIEMNSEALLCLKAIDEKAYGAIIQLRDKREEELSNVSK